MIKIKFGMRDDCARKASEEHKAILDAVINKDAERAEKLANEHIFQSMANIEHQGLEKLMEKHENQSTKGSGE